MKNPFRYGSKVTGGAFYDRVVDGVYRLVDPLLAHHLRQAARSLEAF